MRDDGELLEEATRLVRLARVDGRLVCEGIVVSPVYMQGESGKTA